MGILTHTVKACSGQFVTNDHANEVEGFFKEHNLPQCERAIKQTLEKIRGDAAWLEAILAGKLSQDGFFDFISGLYLDKAEPRERAESKHNEMDDLLG